MVVMFKGWWYIVWFVIEKEFFRVDMVWGFVDVFYKFFEVFLDVFIFCCGGFFEVEEISGIVVIFLIEGIYFFLERCSNVCKSKDLFRDIIEILDVFCSVSWCWVVGDVVEGWFSWVKGRLWGYVL